MNRTCIHAPVDKQRLFQLDQRKLLLKHLGHTLCWLASDGLPHLLLVWPAELAVGLELNSWGPLLLHWAAKHLVADCIQDLLVLVELMLARPHAHIILQLELFVHV